MDEHDVRVVAVMASDVVDMAGEAAIDDGLDLLHSRLEPDCRFGVGIDPNAAPACVVVADDERAREIESGCADQGLDFGLAGSEVETADGRRPRRPLRHGNEKGARWRRRSPERTAARCSGTLRSPPSSTCRE